MDSLEQLQAYPIFKDLVRFQRGCARKVRFDKRVHAKIVARKYGHRIYRCHYCQGYHLTSRKS